MDKDNIKYLNEIVPSKSKAKILLFGEFDPQGNKIISDPYLVSAY